MKYHKVTWFPNRCIIFSNKYNVTTEPQKYGNFGRSTYSWVPIPPSPVSLIIVHASKLEENIGTQHRGKGGCGSGGLPPPPSALGPN